MWRQGSGYLVPLPFKKWLCDTQAHLDVMVPSAQRIKSESHYPQQLQQPSKSSPIFWERDIHRVCYTMSCFYSVYWEPVFNIILSRVLWLPCKLKASETLYRMKAVRGSKQVSAKCVTLVCGVFWAEDNQDPEDSRTTFTSPWTD